MRVTTSAACRWSAVLPPERAGAAFTVACDVANRLLDPQRVEAAALMAREQTSHPEAMHWVSYGIAQGFAGLALLWGALDHVDPNDGWDVIAHDHLTRAAGGADEQPLPPPGIFAGISGLAFAAWYASRAGTRYQRLLTGVDSVLLPQVIALTDENSEDRGGCPVGYFDAISGLAGIGAYLLCRRERPECAFALNRVLRTLVELTQEDAGVPRWYTPPELLTDEWRAEFPAGNANCGLAHGIPGPLALLALAALHDVRVDGITDAIDRTAAWLCRHRADDQWGMNWPYAVPVTRPSAIQRGPEPSRTAWCYGTPGVARALWLAGAALDDTRYRDIAIGGMEAVLRKPPHQRGIPSPTFCHGAAGLLQVVLRFAQDTGLPHFADAARDLAEQLLALYSPEQLLGYRTLDPDGAPVDNPGLLDGAPGVALVLLAAATPVEPAWDRLFLLS
jgi:lantibiotic modifying enzyme